MNSFYQHPRQYSADDLQSVVDLSNNQDALMGMIGQNGMDPSSIAGGPSLEAMMQQQNEKEMLRRRASHNLQSYSSSRSMHGEDPRRSSMLEFGSSGHAGLDGFQFDPTPVSPHLSMHRSSAAAQQRLDGRRGSRPISNEGLTLNTSYSGVPSYGPMASSSPYDQTMGSVDSVPGFDMTNDYMASNMMMGIDFSANPMDSPSNGSVTPRNPYSQNSFTSAMTSVQAQQNFSTAGSGRIHDPGGGGTAEEIGSHTLNEKNSSGDVPVSNANQNPTQQSSAMSTILMPNPMPARQMDSTNPVTPIHGLPPYNPTGRDHGNSHLDASQEAHSVSLQGQNDASQHVVPQYRNAYSASGFDMLGVLIRVATRPKPQINIGAVDMSCAFVVCDVTQHDLPIVYCSDVFERLTAYTRHEILGRNCRFLQAPDGKIQAGVKRKYVDDKSVFRIKNMIAQRQETQISVINYRKGGQPFMNLLTMIPITWDTNEVKYYVGLQVDLVEQPTSITNKNPDGSYTINYKRGLLPRYVLPENQNNNNNPELGQTVHRDDVSTVLSTIGSGESELSRRIWDKVLLENTDDVVHVLSLKGLFLYLSPSSRKVLEYDPSELVGTALSSVCHPSDIVPVTRELKDTSTGAAVNVVFRIRRKQSGYTWFESHGSLHLEQGKGRKCIIMVGRTRPVYALAKSDVDSDGGFSDTELWTKMSTSGMFLFVSSNVRSLLDRQPEDLIGTSAHTLMRQESKLELGKKLEIARTGVKATFKHDVQNKRGQTLQARTTLYPGDATEGQKPTFLIAQTRLLKPSRNKSITNISPKTERNTDSPTSSSTASGSKTPSSSGPGNTQSGITTQAGGSGLVIGSQSEALASEDNVFDELKTTRSTSWQFELRQMEKRNRLLAEELQSLLSSKKKRKRRNGAGNLQKDCANCHTRATPEWRRGPSGNRDLCNSCGLRWAKENGRITPRTSSNRSTSPIRNNADAGKVKVKSTQQQLPGSSDTNDNHAQPPAPGQEGRVVPNFPTNAHSTNPSPLQPPTLISQGFGAGRVPPKMG